ncbi:hypothetical protein [Kitasatospora herbaricolor]|uniref:Uncharacterized protein n=1 Tax=Kitasatospora herbaricolor TaxID=68217 RepID=A0ABZ1WI61_9ACTN|nr:hypothetical protein [Kitasatospora herbaricolor]
MPEQQVRVDGRWTLPEPGVVLFEETFDRRAEIVMSHPDEGP